MKGDYKTREQLLKEMDALKAEISKLNKSGIDLKKEKETLLIEKPSSEKILESVGAFIITLDIKANITLFNSFAEKLTGYKKKEVLGKNWFDIFMPKGNDTKIYEAFSNNLKKIPNYSSYENTIFYKDGSERLMRWENTVMKNKKGELSGVFSIGIDITQRKQELEILQGIEETYRTIFEAHGTATMVVEEDSTIVQVNRACERITGFASSELLGQSWTKFVYQEDLQMMINRKKARNKAHKTTPDIYEVRLMDSKGDIRYTILSIGLIPHTKSNTVSMTDITERRKAEEEIKVKSKELEKQFEKSEKQRISTLSVLSDLNETAKELRKEIGERKKAEEIIKHSETRYKDLAEKGNIAIAVDDINGNLLYFNKQFADLFGYSMKEMQKKNYKTLIHADDFNNVSRSHKNHFRGGKELSRYEFKGIKKDGTSIDIEISVSKAIEKDNKIIGTRTYLWNITDRKRTQKLQETLYDISNAINTVDNLKELYFIIKKYLGNVINTKNFFIALYDEKTDTISLPYHVDEKDHFDSYPAGKTLSSYVIQTEKPLFATCDVVEELIKKGVIENVGIPSKIWLGVPLKIENKIIGIISVQSYDNANLFSKKDIELLSFVSGEIALAINREKAKEQIKKDLKEKTILLQEIYHRTRNTIAVITGMLSIHSRRTDNKYIKDTFIEMSNKIKSMSLVHQKLYKAKDLSRINLKEYLEDLVCQIRGSYYNKASRLSLKLQLEEAFILIDCASTLGLIMNELITNIFKHAFPEEMEGEICIRMQNEPDDIISIHLSDNGVGIPAEMDLRKEGSLGLETMFSLVDYQLKGEVIYFVDNGLNWQIKFKKKLNKVRV